MKPDDPMSTTETPSGTQPSVTSPRRRHEDFSRTREGAYHLRGANDFEAVIEFLRAIDPSELSDEEYTAIEEVILQAYLISGPACAHPLRLPLGQESHHLGLRPQRVRVVPSPHQVGLLWGSIPRNNPVSHSTTSLP